ncbi:hypothetical protein AArcS_1307 [Natranaeroarchaeum sulfidigenes]|uniref:Uncharacterized protein n=1 Tax=Natranaeroarchaeum sulfidigenes TaxID=2784880 RepID=A0A897MPK8_9EURY|nr:hypothetical protein AArcS_1307 [Natranaeroarchaeum sulfidigenes]
MRGGGGGGASEEADSEEEESSSSLRSRIGDTVDSARDRVSDTIGSDDDDESEESTDSDTKVRETSREAADEEPEPASESESESEDSESSDQSESEDRGIRDRAEDVVDRGREIAEDPRGAVEDAADTVRDAPEEIRDRASEIETGPSVDAGSIDFGADVSEENVQQDLLREQLAGEDQRVEADDVELQQDGSQFDIQVTGESAQRLESGVSGSDARDAFGSVAEGASDTLDSAGEAFAPMAAGAAFEFETARRSVGDPAERLPGVGDEVPDSRPERARGAEETAPRDELRQQVAEDTRFDEDEITVGFDVSSGQLEADVRDEVVEEEVRQEVLDDIEDGFLGSGGADPERVQVERTEDGVEVDIQRESGISGVGAIIRGEQTDRDFLVAEDERFVEFGEDVGDLVRGEDSTTRQFAGSGTETGIAFASPAGGVLFAEEAGEFLSDSVQPGIGGTGIRLDVDEDDADAARRMGEGAVDAFRDDPVEASGSAAGAAVATLAPIGAPRVGRAARDRSPDFDLRLDEFRRDQTAQLDQRQRRSSEGRQAEERTISRDSPEADPSDPTVAERVDQITERWGGEGTMTRPDRGLDEAIVVEPQQRGRQHRSPEDQLPPREEFPSDAAFQRELDAVRDRMGSQDVGSRTTTREATADSAVPQGGRTRGVEGMGSRFDQRQTAATALAVPGEQLTESAQPDAQMDLLQVQDQQSQVDTAADAALDARLDTDSLFGSMTGARSDSLVDSTQTQAQTQTQTQGQRQQLRTRQRSRPRRPRFDLPDEADGQPQTEVDPGRDAGWVNPIERLGRANQLDNEPEPPEEGQSWRWF